MKYLMMILLMGNTAFAKEVKVHVNGMVCAFCGQGITKKFNARSEVKKVNVSLKEKTVTLDLNDGSDIPDKEIESILKDSGYNVEKIER
jgi:mercuric ion binding protein